MIHTLCGSPAYSAYLEMWCLLQLSCIGSLGEKKRKDYAFRRQFNEKPSIIPGCPVSLGASSTPGTHMQAVHHKLPCYLPCAVLERGLKHFLQCTAFKTIPSLFRAWNQSRTSRRLTTMVPPELSMRTTNSFFRKCHAASFTTCLSVKQRKPFFTNTYDMDNDLKVGDKSAQARWLISRHSDCLCTLHLQQKQVCGLTCKSSDFGHCHVVLRNRSYIIDNPANKANWQLQWS